MMNESVAQRFKQALRVSLCFVALIWFLKCVEWLTPINLRQLGIYPREIAHLVSIFFAPLIHGSFSHISTNTPAIIVLGTCLLFGYPRAARMVIPAVWLLSGLGVWLFARSAYHIGASGLTFGMMFFVFTAGALRWDPRAIALSCIVFFLYGSMVWGIFPGDPGISYEYHFFGAAVGIGCAILFKDLDPPPFQKKYSWEVEDDLDDDNPYWLDKRDEYK
ncbi:MAG: rhomboid family intramembrane serine protease [Gammaproteobacteria bacterium]